MIDLITTYYGNAIRQNKTCLSDMRKAVWAVYFHIRSSDEEPLHSFCPVGPNSWCKYQNQVVEGSVETFRHSNKLPVTVMDAIKPVFNDLSQPKLLQKCLGETRKLIVPQSSQTYAQAAKSSIKNSSTQTDENITNAKCPPLKLLQSLPSIPKPNISITTPVISISSSTHAEFLPSTSSTKATISKLQPHFPVSSDVLSTTNNKFILLKNFINHVRFLIQLQYSTTLCIYCSPRC
ncbi:uncharacterized protein TNCV_2822841 [Trichonephila clavipes]|nr:uncharacterized protein TNCV_2822841 [Trichonephila clavipes]